jgi:HlyD family secretion protein
MKILSRMFHSAKSLIKNTRMKRKKTYILLSLAVIIIAAIIIGNSKKPKEAQIFTTVNKGEFEVVVNVTGELEAMNKENIMAPAELMGDLVRLYQVKIQDLIPEGTIVDSGDWVATLDKTEITTRLRDVQDELERQKSSYMKTQLDTSIQLRGLRDEILNLQYDLEETKIALEQSKYEPPATIRQNQINVEKTTRSLENTRKNYNLRVMQAVANMNDAMLSLNKQQRRFDEIQKVINMFSINAPKRGMVIYAKEWRGEKRKVGSSISPWDPTVATLPDLTVMISRTYVSEVDINKIKVGQKVRLGVDAFPDRKYTGEVSKVSNVGEQLPGSDSKVFEVIIRIFGYDPVLRPYMTTSNNIIINTYKDVVYAPLETIHSEDSITFVYKKNRVKQIVMLGDMNSNEVIIEKGLEPDEELFLAVPEKADKFRKSGSELIPLIKEKAAKKKKEKEERERQLKEQTEQTRKSFNIMKGFPSPGQ